MESFDAEGLWKSRSEKAEVAVTSGSDYWHVRKTAFVLVKDLKSPFKKTGC